MRNANLQAINFTHKTISIPFIDVRALAAHYATQLQLCNPPNPTSFSRARIIHAHIITSGFIPRAYILFSLVNVYCKHHKLNYAHQLFDELREPNIAVATTLVSAYCKLGILNKARQVFEEIPVHLRDVVCYNAIITGYNHSGHGTSAIRLFREMLRDDVRPDHFTYSSVLSALSLIADDARHCYQLHCAMLKSGLGKSTSVLNSLISVDMACACSASAMSSSLLRECHKLFDEMQNKDELTLTAMITGYAKNDDLVSVRQIFDSITDKPIAVWHAVISGYVHHGLYFEAFEFVREDE